MPLVVERFLKLVATGLGLVQGFLAFDLQIAFDRTGGKAEISATVSETAAESFNNKDLPARGGLSVVPRDIAGARFVSRYHPRIVERVAA